MFSLRLVICKFVRIRFHWDCFVLLLVWKNLVSLGSLLVLIGLDQFGFIGIGFLLVWTTLVLLGWLLIGLQPSGCCDVAVDLD